MEVTQFYFHLPSNSSLDKFPNKTVSEYRVGLPETISLTGEWEVALTEINYPHTWNNVHGNFWIWFYLRKRKQGRMWEILTVPSGHCSSIEDMLQTMNELVNNEELFKDDVKLSYNTLTRKVTVQLQNNTEIYLGDVGYVLGFSPEITFSNTTTAEREADLEHGFNDLFIYCDILQSQYVGDALVPLLRIVPEEGKDGQRISKSFVRPQYVPVSRKQFETIEVNIKRDTGEPVPFEFGRVLITLHFRQSRPLYL